MDRVFLDANVLFSAAYREGAGLLRLWKLPRVVLVTSDYALAEARENLDTAQRRSRLDGLMDDVELVREQADSPDTLAGVKLPPKDTPIIAAAIRAGATHLLTGDLRHFGPYFGKTIRGVAILTPADYLADKTKDKGR